MEQRDNIIINITNMEEQLRHIQQASSVAIQSASSMEELEQVQKKYLGKGGELQSILKGLKDLSPEDKQTIGKYANEVREQVTHIYEKQKSTLHARAIEEQLVTDIIDITLPGRSQISGSAGSRSPFAVFSEECAAVFKKMGFGAWDGQHIVSDYQNFEALNFPENHPARAMQDTFYLEDKLLLRTHTSSLQNEILQTGAFPIRAIVPGKCFRNEATDARHEAIFMQLEGMVVDEGITVEHLIGTLETFLKEIFKRDIKTRIRPGYFPFVEPGLELETECLICGGAGGSCRLCKGLGWIEVMPCGMIHPSVLEMAGVDSKKYSGFAFGFGVSRLAQLKYNIEDCRLMFSAHPKYLEQF